MKHKFPTSLGSNITHVSVLLHLYGFIYLRQLFLSDPHKGLIIRSTFEPDLHDIKALSSYLSCFMLIFFPLYVCPGTLYKPIQSQVEDMKSSCTV